MQFQSLYDEVDIQASDLMKTYLRPFVGFDTTVTHAGYDPINYPDVGRPVVPPISLSTTFQQLSVGVCKYEYSRAGNHSRCCLEDCIAELESGDNCSVFSSGLSALSAIVSTLSEGSHIVTFDDLYGGTGRYFRRIASKSGISTTMVDMRDLNKFKASLQTNTRLVFVETPSNPMMRLVDIEGVSRIAHDFDQNLIVIVDSTFMSPYFQRPLDHGADVVLHSLTKYMNGHSDVVMGALVFRNRPDLAKEIQFNQMAVGAVPSPFDCYLCLRGLRTLSVRMKAHMRNGLILALMLERHPRVEKVLHPGLASFPQQELVLKQMHGFSGMVTVYLRCSAEQTQNFVKSLKLFLLAESLGGFESLIEIPCIMTHASVPEDLRKESGITDNLIRISVGLEDPKDLAKDMYEALDKLA